MNPVTEVAPGFWTIRLPLPFELQHVNVGLVRLEGGGYLLIDTGMSGRASFEALEASLARMGVRWPEIATVVATHIHPDHIGAARKVLAASNADLWIDRAEFDYLNTILAGETPWVLAALTEAGVPRESWPAIRDSLAGLRGALSPVEPRRLLEGGETVPTALGPAQVIPTPGHSAGNICLYWPQARILYSGDHLIEMITPNIAWMPGRDMLGEYLESLDRVGGLDIETVVSSHGKPFGNHRGWIAEARQHHAERCDEILRHLTAEPRTAAELAPVLWDRDFSSFHFYFALFEVLAHLEYMHRRNQVGYQVSPEGVHRWTSLN